VVAFDCLGDPVRRRILGVRAGGQVNEEHGVRDPHRGTDQVHCGEKWRDRARASPAEFRQRAVELARRGDQPIAELAQRLQISESCLHRWILQADIDDNGSDSRLTSVEKRELAQLRRDNRRLHRENQLLMLAVAYFAQDNILGGSSIGQPRSDSSDLRGEQCLDALG
jgi:transposase